MFDVVTYTGRGQLQTFAAEFSTIKQATKAFMKECALCIRDVDTCVLLTEATGRGTGIVLASKSTGNVHAAFDQSYFDRLPL